MPNSALSVEDLLALQQGVYGEMAGASDALARMAAQSALSRHRSGMSKEFGKTMPEITQKGYYAVSKKNVPYQQAVIEKFPDVKSKARWGEIKKLVESIVADEDYGEHQFYFTQDEVNKLKARNETQKKLGGPPAFNFEAVKPKGKVEDYLLYGY